MPMPMHVWCKLPVGCNHKSLKSLKCPYCPPPTLHRLFYLYLKVGAGMLGLPHAFAEAGSFVGVLLLLVAGIASSLYVTSRRT